MFPELPFLLYKLPVADPLLSCLCINPSGLVPMQYDGGWALGDDIWKAWINLEKGLVYISDLLLTSTEQSSCGTSARYAIRFQEHWPLPEDYGYRNLHSTFRAAELSIRRSHEAFQILVARCSLAFALWTFPGPVQGNVPVIPPLQYDSVTATIVPDWYLFLRQASVPLSWIDALSDSIITDFSINLRVGTVLDPDECPWLPIAPVLRAANVPIIVLWRGPKEINHCLAGYPFMKSFVPASPKEVQSALQHLPARKPCTVCLCCNSKFRPVPDYSVVDGSAPPFGPYQLPGESSEEFFARRECYCADAVRHETQLQTQWRHAWQEHAQMGNPPLHRSRVYLWVKVEVIYPDVPPQWIGHEYRHPIPPSAYRSLWMVHPVNFRKYNAYYDEWDLWFPAGWETSEEELLGLGLKDQRIALPSHQSRPVGGSPILDLPDEDALLNPPVEERQAQDVRVADNFYLRSWYGIAISDVRRDISEVDYTKWDHDPWHLFGETRDSFSQDEGTRKYLLGWVSAVMDHDWNSRALEFTWDLDHRHPNFIFGPDSPDPCLSISMKYVRTPRCEGIPDYDMRWMAVNFKQDPANQPWTLLTTSMGAVLIIRRLLESDVSADALVNLLCAGVPVRTGIWLERPPTQDLPKPVCVKRRLNAPWRKKGERPTLQDYEAYCMRILEVTQHPHASRVAWLKGGIVWQIMTEVTGKYPRSAESLSYLDKLQNGPSAQSDHYEAVSLDLQGGGYYDDSLSVSELDIIAGVVRVYTGRGDQTEDASWWPKHSAWVKASGYTGLWSTADERWFQWCVSNIYNGTEGPLNAGQWKDKLKRQKKAGTLASIIDGRAWEVVYRRMIVESD